jgi:hypothetical protein
VRKVLLMAVFALALTGAGLTASSSGASYWHPCQPPPVFISASLKAHHVGCPKARGVVNGYLVKTQQQGSSSVKVQGYACHQCGEGFACHRGGRRIKLHGVPG